jgi:hypothetical protein
MGKDFAFCEAVFFCGEKSHNPVRLGTRGHVLGTQSCVKLLFYFRIWGTEYIFKGVNRKGAL